MRRVSAPSTQVELKRILASCAPVSSSLLDLVPDDLFFTIDNISPAPVHVKCEGLNAAGSIKIKAAVRIVKDLEESGQLTKGKTLIESSSGNLGVAISMIAAERGYRFICVMDANSSEVSVRTVRALGGEVIIIRKADQNGGYLNSRIELIKEMLSRDPDLVWVNQYANESNWRAHYSTTAPEILRKFPKVDWLVIGAGTTGTLTGCARYFREASPATRIVGVDAVGSVTFGQPGARRLIPGLGTSRRPEIADVMLLNEVVHVAEEDTVRMCRRLACRGLFVGGSTGTVLSAMSLIGSRISASDIVVTISPDLGGKYLDTIFDDAWVKRHFPDVVLGHLDTGCERESENGYD